MRHNPVEMLAVINPDDTWERRRNLLLAAGAGALGYALYHHRLRHIMTSEEAARIPWSYFGLGAVAAVGGVLLWKLSGERVLNRNRLFVSDLDVRQVSSEPLPLWAVYLGEEQIGEITIYEDPEDEGWYRVRTVDSWEWSPAESMKAAKEAVLIDYRLEGVEALEANPRKYFVRIPDESVSYPRAASKYYPGGYPLRKAQDFARIGSQSGGPREVRRGRRGGPKVRTYKKGKRTWPATRAQAKKLYPAEVPKRLRAN